MFVKALYWSVGASIDGASREKFDAYIRLLLAGKVADDPSHANFLSKNRTYDTEKFGIRSVSHMFGFTSRFRDALTLVEQMVAMPKCDDEGCSMIFDVRFDAKKGLWIPWVDAGARSIIPKTASYNSIVVPTVDTVRHEWLMNELLTNGFHVLCTGETVSILLLS
jgi:dynein heavy chain